MRKATGGFSLQKDAGHFLSRDGDDGVAQMSEGPASAPASLPDDENILLEILLRLPPLPSSLPRASLVSKLWRRIVSDPDFHRRFRAHHKTPPLLGFFFTNFGDNGLVNQRVNVFAPTLCSPDHFPSARFSFPPGPGEGFFLGCRHGLALLILKGRFQAVLWDPVTNSRCCIDFPPEFKVNSNVRIYHGAVLRDRGTRAFKLVMIASAVFERIVCACIYDSESGNWGNIISTVAFFNGFRPSVLVGNTIYWLICRRSLDIEPKPSCFLQIDVDRQSLAVIQMSEDIPFTNSSRVQALRMGDGGLGFAVVSEQRIQVWGRTAISGHVVRGVLQRTVELEQLLSLRPSMETRRPSILGYDEDTNVIFLRTAIGVFMIQLESTQVTKVSDDTCIRGYFPFTSFYAAGC